MGPEEEAVEEARQRYLAALRYRVEAAEQARQAEWARNTGDVERAREAYQEAQRREEANALLTRGFELLHRKTSQEHVNGL